MLKFSKCSKTSCRTESKKCPDSDSLSYSSSRKPTTATKGKDSYFSPPEQQSSKFNLFDDSDDKSFAIDLFGTGKLNEEQIGEGILTPTLQLSEASSQANSTPQKSEVSFSQENEIPAESFENLFEKRSPFYGLDEERLSKVIPATKQRYIPLNPHKVLDAPSLQDDYYLNLVDWSNLNELVVGL